MKKTCIFWVCLVSVCLLQSSSFAQLPAGWIEQSGWLSGSFGPDAGNATVDAGTFELSGGGPDIWLTSDGGHFLLREVSGDGEIIARCLDVGTGSNAWTKGGIMIRSALEANSAHAHVLMTGGNGGGGILQWRLTDGGGSAWPGDTVPAVAVPKWLKLERIGDEFTGYFSDDGNTWTQTGPTQTIAMTDSVYAGFAVSSHQNGELRTFVFDSLESSWFSSNTATAPSPEHEAIDILRDVVLGWGLGELANTHTVFFGTVFDDVNDASTTDPLGVLVSANQTVNTYDPDGSLDFGQTYYWRVDEVNSAPDFTVFKGDVWTFTVEPFSVPITGVTATASSSFGASTPEKTIDGSGLVDDLHGTSASDMWISVGVPATVEYAFDRAYKLQELWVWNSNQSIEAFIGFGAKDVVIEHSLDGQNWTVLEGVGPLAQAPGTEDYAHNNTIGLGGVTAQHVRVSINTVQGFAPQASLSEVRFFSIPTLASRPSPDSGATNVAPDLLLSWGRDGREAESHEVYVGTNANDLALAGAVIESSFSTDALDLQLGTTYTWRVDEVNEAMDPSVWTGDLWSFATVDTITVDDMESYKDEEFLEIWATWIDGFGDPANGSVVGNGAAGTPETGIVQGGSQSLPMDYDNGAAAQSEATRTFDAPMDWTRHGVQGLVLYFQGSSDNTGGALYVKINDTRVPYDGDAANLMRSGWNKWYIPLADVAGNLNRVNSLTIGIDGGGAGVVYVDDIFLTADGRELITPVESTDGLVAYYPLDGDVGKEHLHYSFD